MLSASKKRKRDETPEVDFIDDMELISQSPDVIDKETQEKIKALKNDTREKVGGFIFYNTDFEEAWERPVSIDTMEIIGNELMAEAKDGLHPDLPRVAPTLQKLGEQYMQIASDMRFTRARIAPVPRCVSDSDGENSLRIASPSEFEPNDVAPEKKEKSKHHSVVKAVRVPRQIYQLFNDRKVEYDELEGLYYFPCRQQSTKSLSSFVIKKFKDFGLNYVKAHTKNSCSDKVYLVSADPNLTHKEAGERYKKSQQMRDFQRKAHTSSSSTATMLNTLKLHPIAPPLVAEAKQVTPATKNRATIATPSLQAEAGKQNQPEIPAVHRRQGSRT